MKKKLSLLSVLVLLIGCGPTQPVHDYEFNYCWEALRLFFIYQERLPQDPYVYVTPAELYQSVNDPYTCYFNPVEAPYLLQALTTRVGGIGILLDTAGGRYYIKQVFLNSPGEHAGLRAADTLIRADTTNLTGLTRDQASEACSGTIGDTLRLDIKRLDSAITVTVILGEYLAPSVFVDTVDSASSIAYILLTMFSDSTVHPAGSAGEFSEALDKTAWAKYTILDLRHNPGGQLEQCQSIVSQFVPKNTSIINMKERMYNETNGSARTLDTLLAAGDGQKAISRIFAVIVDDYTASASEVLVSCLKERRSSDIRIFGQKTYGKGSGWGLFMTPKNGIATVTMLLLTPLVNPSYNHVGIDPDVPVDTTLDAEQIALTGIHNGDLGKIRLSAHLGRSNALRAMVMPRVWFPMCVVKPYR